MEKILVTGAAGFIGSKLAYELAIRGYCVIGIDNLNDYYDVRLKEARLREFGSGWTFIKMSLEDKDSIDDLFRNEHFDKVVNLAAQAGVRYSIVNPYAYIQSNVVGFLNILEACRHYEVKHLVFASSSSVYGMNAKVPYNEDDKVDCPVSLYAATKKSNELMAHSYSKLYGLSVIGLRYFTVYGPWGRPDMFPMLLADALQNDKLINVYNNGDLIRDFTYIDDIVDGTIAAIEHPLFAKNCDCGVAYKIYNIGCGSPVKLMDFIDEMECAFGKNIKKHFLPMQQGDVYQTNADTSRLVQDLGYNPRWQLKDGLSEFVSWFKSEKNILNY